MMRASNLHVKAKFWRRKPPNLQNNYRVSALSFVYRIAFFMNPYPQKDTLDCLIGLFVSMSAAVVDTGLGTHQKTLLSSFFLNL